MLGIIAEYDYNAFAEVIINRGNTPTDPDHIANVNPFRWKGNYYDTETNLYYMETVDGYRYYDPFATIYLNAARPERQLTNAFTIGALNRNGVGYNPIWLVGYVYTIYSTCGILSPIAENINWWKNHWRQVVYYGVLAILIMTTFYIPGVTIAGASFLEGLFLIGTQAAITGFIIGGIMGALGAALAGDNITDNST